MQKNDTPYAEYHRDFLENILKKLFGGDVFDKHVLEVQEIDEENRGINQAKKDTGLYMFYVKPGNKFCPIYVGYSASGSGFYGRFKVHAQSGVVKKFFDKNNPLCYRGGYVRYPCHPTFPLYVIQLPCKATTAILLEKLFLEAFDFALNTENNGDARDTLELGGQESLSCDSKSIFEKAWKGTMKPELELIMQIIDGALKMWLFKIMCTWAI